MLRLLSLTWMSLFCVLALANGNFEEPDPVSQNLRARFEGQLATAQKSSRIDDLRLDQALALFYDRRDYKAAWTRDADVDALLQEIDKLYEDGLNPDEYRRSDLQRQYARVQAGPGDARLRAEFDAMATSSYLRAITHLFRGKVNPKTLSTDWNVARHDMATDQALELVDDAINSHKIAWVFGFARPQHPLYQQMRAGLAQLRTTAARSGWPTLDTKVTLKPGMNDPIIATLRRRLQIAGYLDNGQATGEIYDEALSDAVRRFQRDYFLDDDGAIGPATRTALNTSVQARIDQVRVNLERGRWVLQNLEGDFVLIDVAGYRASYFKDAKRVWQANVQVGKPYRATPIFSSNITHITFNPTWTIPPTILRKDVLPKLRKSLAYLEKNQIRVFDASGRELNPAQIDWNNPGNVVLRQDAGPDGSLGQVAIRFPNSHSVYLHDTPHKELFGKGQRAFSSGCIRVERPLELVELLFNDPANWNRARIDAEIATGTTHNVKLPKPVPILLLYWTVEVRNGDRMTFKPDIYEHDAPLLTELNQIH